MKAYKVLGTTDDVTTCELCGRVELKGTVVLAPLDADGNEDGELSYFGVSCAAKAAGWTQRAVRAGIKAAKDAALAAERSRRIAEREAETKAYNAWVAETYGTGVTLKDAVQKHGVAGLWAQFRAAQQEPAEEPAVVTVDAPSTTCPAPVESRETTITVAGVERLVRTEVGGKIRTVKQLEAAHTKAVKAAVVEMRRANLAGFKRTVTELEGRPWTPRKDIDLKAAQSIARRAERGTLTSWGTYDVATARKPFPKVRYTDEVPEYLVEIEPGHFATQDAAEMLRSEPVTSTVPPVEESAAPNGAAFLASLLGNIAA